MSDAASSAVRRRRASALFAAVCASLLACGGDPGDVESRAHSAGAPDSWSLVLVTLDTTRADALTGQGGPEGLTPALAAFAAEALTFERAYTVAPLTLPAHASVLTGLTPPRHGLRVNGTSRLVDEADTLAELATGAGLETAAFVSAVVLDPAFGLDQGFTTYDAPRHSLVQESSHFADRSGTEVVDAALGWLDARADDARVFLWVHLWDPHGPWSAPAALQARAPADRPEDVRRYLGDVALADQAFERLLAGLAERGRAANSVVAVVGDHGEAFWEQGEYSHGVLLHDATMRVPLLLRFPDGRRAGERERGVASVVDLLPTLARALELPVPAGLDGRDLLDAAGEGGAYLESYYGHLAYGWAPLVGWVDDAGKYLYGAKPRLVDPGTDPEEARDLLGGEGVDAARYTGAIRRLAARPTLGRAAAEAGSAVGAGLSALGYVETATADALPPPLSPASGPDPHERIAEHASMLEALGAFNAGDYAAAETAYRRVLTGNPGNVIALERLGVALIRQRRFEDALVPLERARATGRDSAAGAVNLGTCYRKLERFGEALVSFERALTKDASQVRAVRHLVDLNLMAGRRPQAEQHAQRYEELTGERLEL